MARTGNARRDAGKGSRRNNASAGRARPRGATNGTASRSRQNGNPRRGATKPSHRGAGAGGPELGYLRSVPDLASPIKRGKASFFHLALAYLFGRDGRGPGGEPIPEGEKELCRRHFPALLEAYEKGHGHICGSFYGQHAFAAAAITERDEIDILWSRAESIRSPGEVRLLSRSRQLAYAAYHRLHRYDRRHCQQMIFSVVLELLRRVDHQRQDAEAHTGSRNGAGPNGKAAGGDRAGKDEKLEREQRRQLAELSAQLDDAEDFMLRSATRRTQSHYLKGMLGGTGVVLACVGVISWLLWEVGLAGSENADVLLALSAGALGALVSVLMRMTVGEFSMNLPTLDSEMHDTDVHLFAAARPLIGAVSGVVAYALVRSSLVPVDPAGGEDPTFLWMGIAFLAGFSERLAQDMFARSGRGLEGAVGEAPTSGPSAGLSPPPGQVSRQRARALTRRGRKPAAA
jgi:hypothetical protein